MRIPYVDLRRANAPYQAALLEAAGKVLTDYHYVLTLPVKAFEDAFAAQHQIAECVGVANGFDALKIAMKALGIKQGDKVLVPAFGFVATALAVQAVGGIPVFVDVESHSANMDIDSYSGSWEDIVGIITVHQFGFPANMDAIMKAAQAHNCWVIEDTAQAHFATYKGKTVGTIGNSGCFSFYPTKTLGAFGDAGALITNNSEIAQYARAYSNYGSTARFEHTQEGENSRLDAMQAALLSVKLDFATTDFEQRNHLAEFYNVHLKGIPRITLPPGSPDCTHAYHLYVIQTENRAELIAALEKVGIGSQIHYPTPVHLQGVFKSLGHQVGDFPIAEKLSNTVLSLPFFIGLTEAEQSEVVTVIRNWAEKG